MTQFLQYHTSYSLQAPQIPALLMITTATIMAHSFSLGAIYLQNMPKTRKNFPHYLPFKYRKSILYLYIKYTVDLQVYLNLYLYLAMYGVFVIYIVTSFWELVLIMNYL